MKTLLPALASLLLAIAPRAAEGVLLLQPQVGGLGLQVIGDKDDEWRFQLSPDLTAWTDAPALGTTFSDADPRMLPEGATADEAGFIRAVRTTGLFDPAVLRTIHLTFASASWQTQLASGRTAGTNVPGLLVMDNGVTVTNVGARYKGNTSYTMAGAKKSVNLDINDAEPDARVMGYRAINLNNAFGDETIMREPVYFNVMGQYAPSPHGTLAKLYINGAYWGVYSMVDQLNNDLLDEWFPGHEGDRWRAPNIGGGTGGGGPGGPGGGGGFASGASAFSWLGATVSSYTSNYELKSDNSTNAWERLVHAIDVLNNTPAAGLRDAVEDVFAVDRWLWFLAVENIFADDDSYWNKGADYAFYYEPESGRIHPVEHDGNEAFTAGDVSLSPVTGATGTNRPLLYRLLPIQELRQRYLAHMRTVLAESFHPAVLTPVINHFHQLSVADIITDTKKGYTMASYTNDLNSLRAWVTNRYKFLTNHAELRPMAPTIVEVSQPAAPSAGAPANITARVEPFAAEGVDSVWLWFRVGAAGKFTRAEMLDDGAHGDGDAGDGIYGADTAGFLAGKKVRYYVEARSGNATKTARFAPARAEQEPYTYRVTTSAGTASPVVINEFMADNDATLADPQGDFDDWIELHNLTDEPVDLTGHFLSDNPDSPRKWPFPEGTVVPGGGYLLIWADENGSDTPGLHASFKLSASGEQILLVGPDADLNPLLDSVTFGTQSTDQATGRPVANPSSFTTLTPTPGQVNP